MTMFNRPKLNAFTAITAMSLLSTDLVIASGGPSISFTGGIQGRGVAVVGEIFYEASFSVNYTGGPVILSRNPDGTGDFAVDDILIITVIGPDSVVRTYTSDFSNNCAFISGIPPQDIATFFGAGVNEVRVVLKDKCGHSEGADSVWLSP